MTSISSSLTSALSSQLFSKIDNNADNSISKEEFLTARPDDVSESQAGELFDSIDGDGSGDLSDAEFDVHFEEKSSGSGTAGTLSSALLGAILDLPSAEGATGAGQDDDSAGFMDPAELFAAMDSDGDGAVTEAEFVAARPENMSEDQALERFSSIDSEGTGSISLEQFEAASQPQDGGGGAGGSDEETYDPLDTNQDGVVDLQERMAASGSSEETANSTDTDNDLAQRMLRQLEKAIEAYAAAGRDGRDRSAELMANA